jgi:hypothetical protein
MNESGNVSNSVRSRVLSAIAALDYAPNALAAQLSRNGGQPRKRSPRTLLSSADQQQDEKDREPRSRRARPSLKQENKELKRVIKSLAREVIRWKTLAKCS